MKTLSVHDQRQAVLDKIADKCGLPRSVFTLTGDDELTLQPESTSAYSSVDCALSEIKKSKLPLKLGFVGNEAYQ